MDPLVASIVSHSGAVNALDFNPQQQTLIASGGPSGELYIFNLADPSKPTVHQPGTSAQSPSSGAITSVAFHPRHRHILASSSQNGMTVIWDLREKRPAFSFSDPNRSFHCKSIAWNPEQPMHIAAASDDDEAPLVNIWDLHMTIAPKTTLKGHQRGVMAISWCQQDKSLMLSAGKDNRTICWDINSSSIVSEIGSSAHWNLDVQWSLKAPTMLSTCSLDGKVRVYSVSDFDNLATQQSLQLANTKIQHSSPQGITEDDLFNRKSMSSSGTHGSSNNASDVIKISRQLSNGARIPSRPPSWLRRPAGASFAFGGRLISFNGASKQVSLQHMTSNQELAERANALEQALISGDIDRFCQEKLQATPSNMREERQTWSFLQALCQERSPQQQVLSILERDPEVMSSLINQYLRTLPTPPGMLEEKETTTPASQQNDGLVKPAVIPNGADPKDDLFGGTDDSEFESFSIPSQPPSKTPSPPPTSETPVPKKATTPISLRPGSKTEEMLMNALLIGDFEAAVECCVRIGKMADALVIASCGGDKLFKDTQRIFFRQNKDSTYLSIAEALVNRDVRNFVERVELEYWREALVIICCHIGEVEDYRPLCTLLGERLEKASLTEASTLCFLCSGAVDAVTSSWLNTMNAQSAQAADPTHRHLLIQNLMEKVVIFSAVSRTEAKTPDSVLKQYSRYAELLANQGLFDVALRYLSRLNLNPNTSAHSQSAGAVATAQLLDRVYHALPPQIAQSCYGGTLQSIYSTSKKVTASSNHTTAKSTSAAASRHTSGPSTQNGYSNGSSFQTPVVKNTASVSTYPVTTPSRGGPASFQPLGPSNHFQPAPVSTFQPATPVSTFQPAPVSTFQPAPVSTFQPNQQTPSHGNTSSFARGPQHGTATFQPIQAGTFTPVSAPGPIGSGGVSTFVPKPADATPSGPVAAPPKRTAARVAAPGFTPSPVAPPTPSEEETPVPKKKKGSKKASAAKKAAAGPPTPSNGAAAPHLGPSTGSAMPSLLTGAPVASSPMATGPVSTFQPPTPIGNTFPAATGYAAGNTISSVAIPPPKVRTSRVQAPHLNRSPAPAPGPVAPGPGGPRMPPNPAMGPYHPPTGPVVAAAADPATWDPQAPLPSHLLAAAGAAPGPAPGPQQYATPSGFHPPPTSSFMPSQGGGPIQTFQPAAPVRSGPAAAAPYGNQFASAPPQPAALPPPKPGRAKKESSGGAVSAPTPVYVTGPQAEAMAAPKSHEPTQAELDVLSALVTVLDKIASTGDAAHGDLVQRFEDLKGRISTGQIPAGIIPTLSELANAMLESRYTDAQEKHGEVTSSPHYHAIGSKAMLGLKRMIILIQRYNL